jgi:NAD(P)-dependent dehydrogenase (short-subunit alcohol dehydrogenase family)
MAVALANLSPIRRSGQPLDSAEAALWLASDSSTFVNGQAIAVDGGMTTGPLYRQAHAGMEGLLQILSPPAAP